MTSDRQEGNKTEVPAMTLARASEILSAYGAKPSHWPPAERGSLLALLEKQEPARQLLNDAQDVDLSLDVLGNVPEAPPLSVRVLADFDRLTAKRAEGPGSPLSRAATRLRDRIWPGAPLWQPASALALSLLVGLAMGAVAPSDIYAQNQAGPESSPWIDQPLAIDLDRGN